MAVIFSSKMNKFKKIIVRLRDTTERWVVISDYFRSPESQIDTLDLWLLEAVVFDSSPNLIRTD